MDDFGFAVGPRVSFTIDEGGSLEIGPHAQFRAGCEVWAIGGHIAIARNVFFNRNCSVISRASVEIGEDCLFGPNVGVYDHEHGFGDPTTPMWAQPHRLEPVVIGADVWVGANVVITAGAHIGDRVVVGANSVVTGTVESGTMVAGVPAKVVRRL